MQPSLIQTLAHQALSKSNSAYSAAASNVANHVSKAAAGGASAAAAGSMLGPIGLLASLGMTAYNVFSDIKGRNYQKQLNKLAQSNFENQFQIAAKDLRKAGFNPSALFQANQNPPSAGAGLQAPSAGASDITGLMTALTNERLAKAQIKNIDADTQEKELTNRKIKEFLDSPEGNLYIRELLSGVKANESTALAQDEYVSRQKDIIKAQEESNKNVISHEYSWKQRLQYESNVYQTLSEQVKHQLDADLLKLQHDYNLSDHLITSLASDKVLYAALVGQNWSGLTRLVDQALSEDPNKQNKKHHQNIRNIYLSMLEDLRKVRNKK